MKEQEEKLYSVIRQIVLIIETLAPALIFTLGNDVFKGIHIV